jgi:hypothetical protein
VLWFFDWLDVLTVFCRSTNGVEILQGWWW